MRGLLFASTTRNATAKAARKLTRVAPVSRLRGLRPHCFLDRFPIPPLHSIESCRVLSLLLYRGRRAEILLLIHQLLIMLHSLRQAPECKFLRTNLLRFIENQAASAKSYWHIKQYTNRQPSCVALNKYAGSSKEHPTRAKCCMSSQP